MTEKNNPLLFRYPPNTRFIYGGFKDQEVIIPEKEYFGESITDKESYRLSLAGKRGAIGSGSNNTGWYMFPDGKYDHDKDFSHFYRKDLSIVEIDNYIKNMQTELENSDSELKTQIESQIKAAEAKKAEIALKEKTTSDSGSE